MRPGHRGESSKCTLHLYRDASGRGRTAGTFLRKGDAKTAAEEQESALRRGVWIDPERARVRFDAWAWEWHKGRHGVGTTARKRDEGLLRNHVIGRDRHPWGFGADPLRSITALDVRAWINALVEAGYSPETVRACHRLFGGILRAAVASKLIPDAPVGRGIVDLPSIERKRERFLSVDELERLASEFGHYYRPLIYTGAYTGARWQELTGLLRVNIDLARAKLHVRTVVERGCPELKQIPKSAAGRRTIGLNSDLVGMLRFHLAGAPNSEYVFPGRHGGRLNESNFRRRQWNPAVERAGLAPLTFHDLRHTHVSWLIAQEWPEFKIVRRAGWRDARMLYTTYGHLFPNHDDQLVGGLDHLAGRPDESRAQ